MDRDRIRSGSDRIGIEIDPDRIESGSDRVRIGSRSDRIEIGSDWDRNPDPIRSRSDPIPIQSDPDKVKLNHDAKKLKACFSVCFIIQKNAFLQSISTKNPTNHLQITDRMLHKSIFGCFFVDSSSKIYKFGDQAHTLKFVDFA